jgi:hypothetical protein
METTKSKFQNPGPDRSPLPKFIINPVLKYANLVMADLIRHPVTAKNYFVHLFNSGISGFHPKFPYITNPYGYVI